MGGLVVETIVGSVLLFGGLTLAIMYASRFTDQQMQRWGNVASEFGLSCHEYGSVPPQPRIWGTVGRVQVDVAAVYREDGQIFTRWRFTYPRQCSEDFTLCKRSMLSRPDRSVDVAIDDEKFERAVQIDTDNQYTVAGYLTPTRRREILVMLDSWPTAQVTATSVFIEEHVVHKTEDALRNRMNVLLPIAEVLAPPQDRPPPQDRKLE